MTNNPPTLNDDSELREYINDMFLMVWRDATVGLGAEKRVVCDSATKMTLERVHQRDGARDKQIAILKADIAYAIGRFQGMEMDSAYLERRYPEWKQLTTPKKTNNN